MGDAYFYHLTHSPVERTLPSLLGKALGAGWRIAVRGRSRDRLDWLDQKLWLGPDDDFLPHGVEGGAHDALQPILLTTGTAANDPACLMAIDGAEVAASDVSGMQRVCILFDGNDTEALEMARAQWRTITAAGLGAKYWSEESGRWEMKSENAPG
ncbi:DNA polymerase III subunit chi [Pseudooceanicola batsensis HTCC2597]|uniref:DNA polymerase III subunit chi n=1 Tax=Pseudooceanicola batsensis (strain ATCC BAA-863 / DSM 15984 / KCTC 12145 / HTCC2597) TaxID=252305 RepID=A3TXB7_PSEBH|nr:DNA polymerase III subunit chi [Pseudooceanicola batsensis]EAQ03477.1 DNA polymerase III subunit chi [Pseudooceanicola batsensis HTCC2597]